MFLTVLLLWAGAVTTASPALLQGTLDPVERALAAAPDQLRQQATVIEWKPDFTYRTLKKGRNRLVCFDLSGRPGQPSFAAECTTAGNLDRVAQDLRFGPAGTRAKPEHGSLFYRVEGADAAHLRAIVTVYADPAPPIAPHVLTPPTPPGSQP